MICPCPIRTAESPIRWIRVISLPNDPIGKSAQRVRRCPAFHFALFDGGNDHRLGTSMADNSEVAYTTADGNDYVAHEQTYEGFIKLVKYGTVTVAVILALMAIFLT
jgi:Bacterial aa3 type cytochrome c oxidase subunit IV